MNPRGGESKIEKSSGRYARKQGNSRTKLRKKSVSKYPIVLPVKQFLVICLVLIGAFLIPNSVPVSASGISSLARTISGMGSESGSDGIFKMDKILKDSVLHTYGLPEGFISDFNFSNRSKICPSNHCKPFNLPLGITFLNTDTTLNLGGQIRLQDNVSNGHFIPKKQALVENIGVSAWCQINDIKEDLKKGTSKYICNPNVGYLFFSRSFNNSQYDYDLQNMTFELPSKHLIIEAQEK